MYKANMRSIYQLFKTELKFTDKESLKAQEEKKAMEAEEKRLYKENERMNQQLLAQQMQDEYDRLEAKKQQAELELKKKLDTEKRLVELADQRVRRMKERVRTFIDPKNLEMEIEKALNEKKSYNFSINDKGQIFRSQAN